MTKNAFFQLIFGLFILGYCQHSVAQVSVGFRGGVLFHTQTQDPMDADAPEFKYNRAIQIAIPVEISLSKRFAIQPEIMFGKHGGYQKSSSTGVALGFTSVATYRGSYNVVAFEIPVLAKLKFDSEHFVFHVLAGPSLGFNTTAEFRQKTHVTITDSNGAVITDSSSDEKFRGVFVSDGYDRAELGENDFAVSKTNFNLHIGAGAGLNLGSTKIYLDLRYILGLSDFAPEASGTAPADAVTIRSNRIGLGVGLLFAL